MSDYSMPVLSEQERDKLTDYCKCRIEELAEYSLQSKCLQIALASLTAKPIEYLTWHQGCRAPDDCEDYSVVASKGEKSCDGSYAFPVYTAPPVPVKQEGEQCGKCKGNGWFADEMGMRRCFMCNDSVHEGEHRD